MDENQSNQDENYHTWELFQARLMNHNPPATIQEHLYAAPPSGERYTTCCITGDGCLCPPGQTCPYAN